MENIHEAAVAIVDDLNKLTPGLFLKVLEEITETQTLLSIITASSTALRACNEYPAQILMRVLTNAIEPVALPYALSLAHFSTHSSPSERQLRADRTARFSLQPQSPRFDFPTGISVLWTMVRTHSQIERFTQDLTREALEAIELAKNGDFLYHPLVETHEINWPAPSSAEKERLQRAFYRFDLYCRIVTPDADSEEKRLLLVGELEKYGVPVASFQPWEKCEFVSIYDFFYRTAQIYLAKLNDQFVKEAKSYCHAGGYDRSWGFDSEGTLHPDTRALTWTRLMPFALGNHATQRTHTAVHVATMGLDFLTKVVHADDATCKQLYLAHLPQERFRGRDLFTEVWSFRVAHPTLGVRGRVIITGKDKCLEPEDQDCRRCGTSGFRMMESQMFYDHNHYEGHRVGYDAGFVCRDPYREMGFAFWDAQRIQSNMPIMEALRDDDGTRRLIESFTYRDLKRRGQCAENQLFGFRIPVGILKDLLGEWGVPSRLLDQVSESPMPHLEPVEARLTGILL